MTMAPSTTTATTTTTFAATATSRTPFKFIPGATTRNTAATTTTTIRAIAKALHPAIATTPGALILFQIDTAGARAGAGTSV